MASAEDPFDCFGDDDDDSQSDNDGAPDPTQQELNRRDPVCGVLTFHSGTEQSLANHVKREMESAAVSKEATGTATTIDDRLQAAKQVLKHVDQYCYTRHWMMHVGDEKGKILQEFLEEFCQRNKERLLMRQQPTVITIVELGTYCGYSSILMAHTILEYIRKSSSNDPTISQKTTKTPTFQILSVDVDPNHQAVAQELVKLAQLEEYISFVLLPISNNNNNEGLVNVLRKHLDSTTPRIDFLFVDHDKDLYVPDLQQLEKSGWIQVGTHVAADNVVFFDIPYRSYIQHRKEQGIVSSELVKGRLEYVIPEELERTTSPTATVDPAEHLQDGIELTVYLKDPSAIAGY